jgi:predicted lipoprotein with Yx(FWY)xxD motif
MVRTAVVATVLLAVVGCGSTDPQPQDVPVARGSSPTSSSSSELPTPTASSTPRPRRGTEVIVDDSEFGPMLYGADGQAIYLFDLESTPQPRCHDDCAAAWPPVLTTGAPVAGKGVQQQLLGTVERQDGTRQVTYAGHPLYFYAHEDPWQVLCHDFTDFGGTWWVVQPDGDHAP